MLGFSWLLFAAAGSHHLTHIYPQSGEAAVCSQMSQSTFHRIRKSKVWLWDFLFSGSFILKNCSSVIAEPEYLVL